MSKKSKPINCTSMLMQLYSCPVPFSQRPLNEFNNLKNSYFFSWPINSNQFLLKLNLIWFINSFINIPIICNFFSTFQISWKFLISDLAISNFILILILVRLYLGWSYVTKRLLSATVFYEESGWYDGQIWVKPLAILNQDRSVGKYQILPLLTQIQKILLVVSAVLLLEFVLYTLL